MLSKPKIAYLMHVDWDWIKQRPHFLYEGLTEYYQVDLFYIYKLIDTLKKCEKNSRNVELDYKVFKLKKLPYSGKIRAFRKVERIINWKSIRCIEEYDYLWITSPIILDFLPLSLLKGKVVIYDCMDDFLSFYNNPQTIGRMKCLEWSLVSHSQLIITSSNYLFNKVISSYGEYMKTIPSVVNNGISSELLDSIKIGNSIKTFHSSPIYYKIMYIGTVGEWVDFDLILEVLYRIPQVKFTMVGPIDTKIPSHSRLEFIGAVKHEKLIEYATTADAFIMPFIINELVRSVDPVKIYEYIFFYKPIISIRYSEMDKFMPFVHLYSNEGQLMDLITNLIQGNLKMYSREDSIQFLYQNTWDARCKQIVAALEGVKK